MSVNTKGKRRYTKKIRLLTLGFSSAIATAACLPVTAPLRLRARARHFKQAAVRTSYHYAPRVTLEPIHVHSGL